MQNYYMSKDIPVREVSPGVHRKILAYSKNLMVCELHFAKGAVGELHKHFHEQCTYIVSGKFEFSIGGVKRIVTAGDATFKEPEIVHGCVCLEEGVLIDIFTPCREDFLEK